MKEFTQAYYDKDYFASPEGKTFTLADGSIQKWGYKNPTGEYYGAEGILKAWKTVFDPVSVLEAGAGRGQFITYGQDIGLNMIGFDFSEWATSDEGRYKRCKPEWLSCLDATEHWPYPEDAFDFVVSLDLMEHIYLEDLEFVISEMYRVASKSIFLQIATVDGVREIGYFLKKGEEIPLSTDGRTWAGHVTVSTHDWWINRLEHEDWVPRRDLVNWFCAEVPKSIIQNWLLNSIIVLEMLD